MLVDKCVHRHQFDGSNAECLYIFENFPIGQSAKLAALALADVWMQHRITAHIQFVEDHVGPGYAWSISGQLFLGRTDDAPRDKWRAIEIVAVEYGLVPTEFAGQQFGIGIDQELGRVAAQTMIGVKNPVHAIAVRLAGAATGHITVPRVVGAFVQIEAPGFMTRRVEQAKLDALRDRRVDREIGAVVVRCGAEWSGAAGLDHWVSSLIGSAFQIPSL